MQILIENTLAFSCADICRSCNVGYADCLFQMLVDPGNHFFQAVFFYGRNRSMSRRLAFGLYV